MCVVGVEVKKKIFLKETCLKESFPSQKDFGVFLESSQELIFECGKKAGLGGSQLTQGENKGRKKAWLFCLQAVCSCVFTEQKSFGESAVCGGLWRKVVNITELSSINR